jgi:hypothetical protein
MGIFGGIPMANTFVKRYVLHYQLKKVLIGDDMLNAQFNYLNFHAKHYKDSRVKLSLAVKNKWSVDWMRAWFYCRLFTEAPW